MASTDVELERQLKEAGKRLSQPPDSVDELLPVLDQVEKLLSKVDQSPKKSMLDSLKPSMKALIHDNLSRHSDVDVKVAVASCISEITRITAPDAPYTDDQMRDVFQLIVSSFEDLADQSSRSYNKRASILETVSKVRSCVIMLDLECDALIVEMFEHFFKSVRDYHLDSIYPSMENIMALVLEESEEVSAELLKPLLASVKKNSEGVLPIARKLGEGVLLKSAEKLKPYLLPAVISLGDTLDNYSPVVAAVCEGTTATIEHNDENASGVQPANESKSTKESLEEAQQADESKLTTASSDHTDQVVKQDPSSDPGEVDPNLDRSPKSVMSNGVNVAANEETSVDQESSKKPDEDESQQNPTLTNKEDTDDSDADKLAKSESNKKEKKTDSAEPSDSSHVEGEKEAEKPAEIQISNEKDVKESSNEEVIPSETEKGNELNVSSPKSKSEKKEEIEAANSSSPSKSGKSKNKGLTLDDVASKAPEETSDVEVQPPKKTGKKTVSATKVPETIDESEDNEASSDSDEKPLTKSKPKTKSNAKSTAMAAKVPETIDESEDNEEASSDSDEKPLTKSKSNTKSNAKSKSTKQSDTKKGKQAGKKTESKQSVVKKGEESDSDAKPLKHSVKKNSKVSVEEEEEESDSENKPLKLSAKKGNLGNSSEVKSSSKKKDDGKKRKNVAEKEQAKSVSEDDEMESSPKSATKSATKSAKGEGNSKETPATSSKRKRSTGKDKVTDPIKYDKSLVGLKVKVFWPEDKMYYEGVIESFDSAKKKHKVSYVDGDEEILNLKTQKWEILQEFTARDEDPTEAQSEEESPETPKKKKSKTDSTPSASQEKIKDSAKKVGTGKSKGTSAVKSTPKASGKSTDVAASKDSGKSKEDEETPKTTLKTAAKSKGKTPQSSKSNTNGPTNKSKSGSPNPKESETPESAKGKSTGGGGSKTGKKRKKRN